MIAAALGALPTATIARAAAVDVSWLGGAGSWNDPTKWSSGVVPNNGANTYNVVIPSGTVTTSSSITVNSIDVSAAGQVVAFNNLIAVNSIVNRGLIAAAAQTQAKLGFGSVQNLGTIESRGNFTQLEGTYTRADLGTVKWLDGQPAWSDNRFVLRGTIQNQNQSFNIGANERWSLGKCVINGGTINVDPAAVFSATYRTMGPIESAALNDVVINGRVLVGAWSIVASNLLGHTEWDLGNANLGGTPALGSTGTLTIASTVLVHGGGGFFEPIGYAASVFGSNAIVNRGAIKADNPVSSSVTGEFDIKTPSFFNEGLLSISSKNSLYATGDVVFRPNGTLEVAMTSTEDQGLLRVLGKLDLTAADDALQLTANPNMSAGTFYKIAITGGGIFSTFDSVTPGFEVMYTSTEIFARAVPEPSVALSLPSVALLLRRRYRPSRH